MCPVAVSMGDPAGVGPELCLRILGDEKLFRKAKPLVFGDLSVLLQVAKRCHLPVPQGILKVEDWRKGSDIRGISVIDCGCMAGMKVKPGQVNAACGKASFGYVREAIQAALDGRVAGVATSPINKEAWSLAGIRFPGHTEAFAALTHASRVCMMLYSERMACGFVTTHIPYAKVSRALTIERILEVMELTHEALKKLRGRAPRLTVCGLNPHAGEHGLFGKEEDEVIRPAIAMAVRKGIKATGPLPPDAAFILQQRDKTDGFICMYHDQGHIPFKMLAFDEGVNISLGLPVVRTSVDHGTAFDIAWRGKASPQSLIQAILCATRL